VRHLAFFLLSLAGPAAGGPLELVSVKRIWDQAPHSAFGDIIRFQGKWFCVFREGQGHVVKPGQTDDGVLRVITSPDGNTWTSAALIAEPGIDLRDPHLSVTSDGRLMVVSGGSEYPQGVYKTRQPRVMFSWDGTHWTAPRRVLEPGHWLWRVTWHDGTAYGVSKYGSPSKEMPENPRRQNLVSSKDGIHWSLVQELKVPGGDETTARFLPGGRMVLFMRRSSEDGLAMIGVSKPPYRQWEWSKTKYFTGGPNFFVLPDGRMIGGGRLFVDGDRGKPKTALGLMDLHSYTPSLILPSGGDTSYPGFAFHDGLLWVMYYSSHEAKTAIYLAKVKVN
jgi:hypothetical protein